MLGFPAALTFGHDHNTSKLRNRAYTKCEYVSEISKKINFQVSEMFKHEEYHCLNILIIYCI